MKIISYNLNGIRAASKLNVLEWLRKEDADIVCLQEVRAEQEICEKILMNLDNYYITYNCGERKGYAGTIILSKAQPDNVYFGFTNDDKDIEGRTIIISFGDFTIINSYIPNGSKRLKYKIGFIEELIKTIQEIKKDNQKLILCCDANIAHNEIDVNKPKVVSKKSGFLSEERKLIDKLLENGFLDTFRELNPTKIQYTWRSYKSRGEAESFGWRFRFDYIICNKELEDKINECSSPDLEYSDHLPVILECNLII